jgi:hypothetical protein
MTSSLVGNKKMNIIHFMCKWIQIFVSMYNDTIANNKHDFELEKEENIILNQHSLLK